MAAHASEEVNCAGRQIKEEPLWEFLMNGGTFSQSGVHLPELREDPLLQAQILVPVLLHQGPLPLDGVVHAPTQGLGQLGADLLLGSLQLDPQGLLVLELSGGEEDVKTRGRKAAEKRGVAGGGGGGRSYGGKTGGATKGRQGGEGSEG